MPYFSTFVIIYKLVFSPIEDSKIEITSGKILNFKIIASILLFFKFLR